MNIFTQALIILSKNREIGIEVIQQLNAGGKQAEDAAMLLFEAFKGYIPTIQSKLNLSTEDVRDAYSDALVKIIRQVKNGSFRGESKISSYFYSIFYNTAVDVTRKNTTKKNIQTLPLEEFDAKENNLIDMLDKKEESMRLRRVIDKIGDSCKKILIDWAYHGYTMEEIAERSNLSNAASARSMKYKCLKKLKTALTS